MYTGFINQPVLDDHRTHIVADEHLRGRTTLPVTSGTPYT